MIPAPISETVSPVIVPPSGPVWPGIYCEAGRLPQKIQLRSILKELIRRDSVAIARLLQKKLELISARPGVTAIQLEGLLEKRRIQESALKQKLFTEQKYNAKKESLTRELTR